MFQPFDYLLYIPRDVNKTLIAHGGAEYVLNTMLDLMKQDKLKTYEIVCDTKYYDTVTLTIKVDNDYAEVYLKDNKDQKSKLRNILLFFAQYEFWTDPRWTAQFVIDSERKCVKDIAYSLLRFLNRNGDVNRVPKIVETATEALYAYLKGETISWI